MTQVTRRGFLGGAGALGLGAVVTYALQPTQQDIDDLEATVEDLDTRVSALETQVAGELGASEAGDVPASNGSGTANTDWVTVEGSGQTVSEKFELAEGTYRVHATVEVSGFDGFAAYIHEPGGGEDLLFNEIIESGGTWEGAAVYEARRSGMYYVEATNTSSDWTMAFEPY